jgi:cytoskeletal protein CcmA (bactofilin family)
VAWKKPDEPPHPEPATTIQRPPLAPPAEPRRPERTTATIGPSIFIKGDLSGDEDLVIEGRVEGKIDLKQHNVTIGKNGRVNADVYGNTVIVEGEVDGNLFAQLQAVVRQSGAVRGNITAPRVILEDGARFRGSVDMDSQATPAASPPAKGSAGGTEARGVTAPAGAPPASAGAGAGHGAGAGSVGAPAAPTPSGLGAGH